MRLDWSGLRRHMIEFFCQIREIGVIRGVFALISPGMRSTSDYPRGTAIISDYTALQTGASTGEGCGCNWKRDSVVRRRFQSELRKKKKRHGFRGFHRFQGAGR